MRLDRGVSHHIPCFEQPRCPVQGLQEKEEGSISEEALERATISPESGAIQKILGLVEQEYGISLSEGRSRRIEKAVERRIAEGGFDSVDDYLRFLCSDARAGREILVLARETANHESYFFREPAHLDILKERLEMLHRQGCPPNRNVQLVSAGSATGEEAYSMAAAVLETGLLSGGRFQIVVHGIDLDPISVEQARQGVYSDYSFRGVGPERLRMWFRKVGRNRFQVTEELKSMVRFSTGNILRQPVSGERETADIIFCRNVLIYMTPQAAERLAEHLHARLVPGGWLIIGHSETLLQRRDLFEPVRRGDAVVYEKR